MNVGARLKELRRRAGLTQAELADRLGIDRSAVAHIEAGKTTTTTVLLGWVDACGGVIEIRVEEEKPAVLNLAALTREQQATIQALVEQLGQGNVKQST